MNQMRGLFITFEGIDGCGKSTHLRLLAESLRQRGLDPVCTLEPGGTAIGGRIREVVLSNKSAGLSSLAELMLYAADRAQHVIEVIKPALDAGRIVISDRHTDSTRAFQGYGRGLDLRLIDELNGLATGGIQPELTILFEITPEIAQSRFQTRTGEQKDRMTRFEDEAREFHRSVCDGYSRIAKENPDRIRVIDASGSVEETQSKLLAILNPILDARILEI